MTVLTAVALAGGFTYRAAKNKAYLIRGDDTSKQKTRVTPETIVRPGDLVEIAERIF